MTNIEKIKELKKALGNELIILAHHYQKDEIINLADFVGDSLKLAQFAQQNKTAKYIVFCGVYFMSETADILTDDWQVVIQPAPMAGCPMADMATMEEAEDAWNIITSELGESLIPLTYVNSTADVKAFVGRHDGATVTSGNAEKVVKWAYEQKDIILFLPDENLGRNTAYDLGIPLSHMATYNPKTKQLDYSCAKEDVKIVLWKGFCHVHHKITTKHVEDVRSIHPDAKIIVHPECQFEIVNIADGKGSTEYLINEVNNAPTGSKFVIGTEHNLVKRLIDTNPDKKIYLLDTASVCTNMNKTSTLNLLEALEDIQNNNFEKQVKVSEDIATDAIKSLEKMLSLV